MKKCQKIVRFHAMQCKRLLFFHIRIFSAISRPPQALDPPEASFNRIDATKRKIESGEKPLFLHIATFSIPPKPRELRVRRRLLGKWQKLPKKCREKMFCVRGNCDGSRWTAENRLERKLSNIDELLQLIFLALGRDEKSDELRIGRVFRKNFTAAEFFPNQIRSVFFSAVNKAGPSLAAAGPGRRSAASARGTREIFTADTIIIFLDFFLC